MEYLKEDQLKKKKKRQKIPMRKKSKRSLATKITIDVRMDVKVRDNGKCTICGTMENIQIHHFVPRSLGGMGITNNLISLCQFHHKQLHDGNGYILEHVKQYMKDLYPNVNNNERKYNKFNGGNK